MAQGNFNYVLYFQTPGVAEAELDADVRRTLRGFLQTPDRARLEELLAAGPPALGPATGGLLDRLPDAIRTASFSPTRTSRCSSTRSARPASAAG